MKWFVVVPLSVIAMLAMQTGLSRGSQRALSSEEMSRVRGGIEVTSFAYPPSDNYWQSADNLQFRLEIENGYTDQSMYIGLYEGSTKMVWTPLTTVSGVGTARMRDADWPLGSTKRDLVTKHCNQDGDSDDCPVLTTTPGGARNDAYISPDLKVARVRFYHLRENSVGSPNPTSVGHSLQQLVDHTGDYVYDWQDTESADAITQQCDTDKTWNFRYAAVHTETVPVGCTFIRTGRGCGGTGQPSCASGTGDQCPNYETVFEDMIDARALAEGFNVADYAHVVFFNSLQRWNATSSSYNGTINGNMAGASATPMVLVRDSLGFWDMSKTMTHELAHRQGLCHYDNTASCTNSSMSHDCAQAERDRNLMCGNGSGRELTAAQCNIMSASTEYKDWN